MVTANCECNCGHRFVSEIDESKPPRVRRKNSDGLPVYVLRCTQCQRHHAAPAFQEWLKKHGGGEK